MKNNKTLLNVTRKKFAILKSTLLGVVIGLNAGFLCCQATDGDYVTMNVGDPGENLPITYRASGSKMVLSWKESGICESSTDLKTWSPCGRTARRYSIKFNREQLL